MSNLNNTTETTATKKDTLPITLVKVGLAYYYAGVILMAVGSVAHTVSNAIESKKASKAE